MTQMQLTAGDEVEASTGPQALFPSGATDVNGQQVDMRSQNSWTMRLHEVSTPELAEVPRLSVRTDIPTSNQLTHNVMQFHFSV
jgi:hypothetical protein